jgi:hypothetical protein
VTKFGKQGERTIEDIGREALIRVMKDAGVGRQDIDEVFCGSSYGRRQLRPMSWQPLITVRAAAPPPEPPAPPPARACKRTGPSVTATFCPMRSSAALPSIWPNTAG